MADFRNFAALSASLLFLAGCSLVPDYQRPDINAPAWKEGSLSQHAEIAADWWKAFGSEELNALVRQALSHNNNVHASLHRIEQARAELRIAGASLLPSASAAAEAMKVSESSGSMEKGAPSFMASTGISYELDLFGANRAGRVAAREMLLGRRYAHDALVLVVMGDVAQNYFNVLNLKERHRLARKNRKNAQDLLAAINARFQAGARTALDIAQQEAVISNTDAEVVALEQELALSQNALATLVGQPAQSFSVSGRTLDNVAIPAMAALQPADLLERRPDVQSAEAELRAANADIGAARAAFFPSVDIGANLLLAANPSASAFSLAASIVAPIFQGGRLEGNVMRTTARQRELAANYQQTVLVSFQEAEDALTKVKTTRKREDALAQAAKKAGQAYNMAKNQYSLGIVDFQSVLDSQRIMLESKDRYAQARFETLSARIDLFKAMGGGWKQK